MTADAIIIARGLKKSFGQDRSPQGPQLSIPAGRIYGLVGHNGAGKTTTLNALLGLTDYEGDLSVLGRNPFAERAAADGGRRLHLRRRQPAALPAGARTLRPHRGHPSQLLDGRKPMYSSRAPTLSPISRLKTLSKGMLAQLHLAVVMAIDAKLLVLDEPTLGLDITYRKRFYRRLLEDYMTEERTLIITTHQVDEIEFMLTDIMFIRDGEIVLDMQTEDLGSRLHPGRGRAATRPPRRKSSGRSIAETRFGQTVMVFDDVDRDQLDPLGEVSTPDPQRPVRRADAASNRQSGRQMMKIHDCPPAARVPRASRRLPLRPGGPDRRSDPAGHGRHALRASAPSRCRRRPRHVAAGPHSSSASAPSAPCGAPI